MWPHVALRVLSPTFCLRLPVLPACSTPFSILLLLLAIAFFSCYAYYHACSYKFSVLPGLQTGRTSRKGYLRAQTFCRDGSFSWEAGLLTGTNIEDGRRTTTFGSRQVMEQAAAHMPPASPACHGLAAAHTHCKTVQGEEEGRLRLVTPLVVVMMVVVNVMMNSRWAPDSQEHLPSA